MKKAKQKQQLLSYEWRRINQYFEILDKQGPAEELWKILKLALTDGSGETESRHRSNMLFFYEHTKELFENIYKLLQQQKKKNNKPNK
jgi:hypothetical protein